MPLLERLRFLTIVSSNLDEFFEIRVAGIKEQIKLGITEPGPEGMTPREMLAIVTREARALVDAAVRPAERCAAAGAGRRRHPLPAARHLERRAARLGARLFQARGAAGPDAARPRPGASVPARLQQEPQPHRRAGGPRRLRPRLARRDRAGAAHPAARDPAAAVDRGRRVLLRLPDLGPACPRGRAVRRHDGQGRLPVPRDAELRALRRRGRNQEPAHRAAGRAACSGTSATRSGSRWSRRSRRR